MDNKQIIPLGLIKYIVIVIVNPGRERHQRGTENRANLLFQRKIVSRGFDLKERVQRGFMSERKGKVIPRRET